MSTMDTTASANSDNMNSKPNSDAHLFASHSEDINTPTAFDDSADFFDKFLRDDVDVDALVSGDTGKDSGGDLDDGFLSLMGGNASMNGSASMMMMDFNVGGNNSTKFPSNHSTSTPPLYTSMPNDSNHSNPDSSPIDFQQQQQQQHQHQLEPPPSSQCPLPQHDHDSIPNHTASSAMMNNHNMSDDQLLNTSMNQPTSNPGGFHYDNSSGQFQSKFAHTANSDVVDDSNLSSSNTNGNGNTPMDEDGNMGRPPSHQQHRPAPLSMPGMTRTPSFHPVDDVAAQLSFGNNNNINNGTGGGNASFASVFPKSSNIGLSSISQTRNINTSNATLAGQNHARNDTYSTTLGAQPLDCFPLIGHNSSSNITGTEETGNSNNMTPFTAYKAKKMQQQQQQQQQHNTMFNNHNKTDVGSRSAIFSNMNAARLKSTMSDGLLTRALKAKYSHTNNGGNGNRGGMGNSNMSFSASNNSRPGVMMRPGINPITGMPRNAISSVALSTPSRGPIAASISRSKLLHAANHSSGYVNHAGSRSNLAAVEMSGSGGGQHNATWGASNTKRSSSAMFSKLLNSNRGMKKDPSKLVTTKSTSSISKLLHSKRHSSRNLLSSSGAGGPGGTSLRGAGSSSASINDFLRNSKKLTKTQSLLRQSSQHSISKRQSFQNLTNASSKVDLSSLLPPSHTQSSHSMASKGHNNHGPSSGIGNSNMVGGGNATFPRMGLSGSGTTAGNNNGAIGVGGSHDPIAVDSSLLHQSCRLYPTTAAVVDSAIRVDPEAVRRAVAVKSTDGKKLRQSTQDMYGYPINIALKHGATPEVVKLLADAGPDVLIRKDGQDGSSSLSIAIQAKCDPSILQILYQTNPQCVQVPDRRANTPLHIAVSTGASFQIVKQLYQLYPKALKMGNFNSQTPLDIAQQSTRCAETVMNFLQTSAFSTSVSHADPSSVGGDPMKDAGFGASSGGGLMSNAVRGNLEDGLDDIMEANL